MIRLHIIPAENSFLLFYYKLKIERCQLLVLYDIFWKFAERQRRKFPLWSEERRPENILLSSYIITLVKINRGISYFT